MEGGTKGPDIRWTNGVVILRWFRRAIFEHRRLPKRVRTLRVIQLWSFMALVSWILISTGFRFPVAVSRLLIIAPLLALLCSVFGVGLLTWRNYERTAEIRAENVRGRGLDSAGLGWLVDTGTIRALGAGESIFTAIVVGAVLIQFWPYLAGTAV